VRPDPDGLDRQFVDVPELDAEFEVWGYCPVQGFGRVLGREFYFRARDKGWSFDVEDSAGNFPSDGYRDSDGFYREGKHADADWMPHREVVALIEHCLREYRAR
jgi:hypothetical protein